MRGGFLLCAINFFLNVGWCDLLVMRSKVCYLVGHASVTSTDPHLIISELPSHTSPMVQHSRPNSQISKFKPWPTLIKLYKYKHKTTRSYYLLKSLAGQPEDQPIRGPRRQNSGERMTQFHPNAKFLSFINPQSYKDTTQHFGLSI